jgi:hypothetical protein
VTRKGASGKSQAWGKQKNAPPAAKMTERQYVWESKDEQVISQSADTHG